MDSTERAMGGHRLCRPASRGAALIAVLLCASCAQLLESPAPNVRFAPLDLSESIAVSVIDLRGEVPAAPTREHAELVKWAMADWARALEGKLRFHMVASEADALIRVRFVPSRTNHYGEMFPFTVNGKRGANLYIRGDADKLGRVIGRRAARDLLFRDTLVYTTCLHELGHALGLGHSTNPEDIMYAMVMGGDVEAYMMQFRRIVASRGEFADKSVLSLGDRSNVRALYAR